VNLLQRVVSSGTGTRANLGTWPVFGKTGSTNDLADAWFAGCTKQICAASWVGHPEGLVPMSNVPPFGRVFGGTAPAQIWHDFMVVAMEGLPPIGFPGVPQITWPTATVPDVVGLSEGEAISVLGQAGFRANPVEADSTQPAGTVVAQSPAGGSEANLGSSVTIEISTGRAPRNEVPDVVGMTESQAVKALRQAGFAAAVSYEPTKRENLHGVVGAQSPGPGTAAKEGATVSITVYEYQKPKPKPTKPGKPSPSPDPSE
jgi:penicillin-binding protein 1A